MKRYILASLMLTTTIIHKGFAQDSHYWQSEFGPGGYLYPGAVVANNQDSGLFFFNPALMAIHPRTSVSISANIYNLEIVKIKDGVGTGKSLKSLSPRIIPAMVSGTIAFKSKKTFSLGYALIQNAVLGYKATQRKDGYLNVLDDSYSPGAEAYVGQYSIRNSVSQTLGMVSAAVKINDKLTVGLSGIGQLRSQDYHEDYKSRAISNADTQNLAPAVTSATSDYEVTYYHVGLQFKGGLAYDAGIHHLGLLITSPMISIKGNATLNANIEISNLRLVGSNANFNLLANDRQTGLPVKYKQPFSIAAAYAIDYGKGQLYASVEYFAKLNAYNIITPRKESFLRPDTGSVNKETSELLSFIEQRKSVVNFSIAGSYRFSESMTGVVSFRTDYTYATTPPSDYIGNLAYSTTWNNYHLQLGGFFKRRKMNLHGGLLLNYGSTNQYRQPLNFDNPNENNIMVGDAHLVHASTFTVGVLLSYIHHL